MILLEYIFGQKQETTKVVSIKDEEKGEKRQQKEYDEEEKILKKNNKRENRKSLYKITIMFFHITNFTNRNV